MTSKSAVDPGIVAFVPMRHRSERVPGKNYRVLSGKPLYGYIIETLLACPEITQIVVNTDSPVIKDGVSDQYPSVKLIQRPSHLCGDMVPMNEILLTTLTRYLPISTFRHTARILYYVQRRSRERSRRFLQIENEHHCFL